MSGDIARRGFLFQDQYLLKRVLTAAAARLDELWLRAGHASVAWHEQGLARFGIEARSLVEEADPGRRDWDVLVENPDSEELIEVKSGTVTRKDLRTFWGRLRREGPRVPAVSRKVVPVLVVDPDKAGELLPKLEGLRAVLEAGPCYAPATEPDVNITTSERLVADALWCLCGASESLAGLPLAAEEARALLIRLEVHRVAAAHLEAEVDRLLGLFFANGLDEAWAAPLLGWLGQRAVATAPQRRYFTIRDLLSEMGVRGLVSAFDADTLRSWRDLWNGAGVAVEGRTRLRLGGTGESVNLEENQPDAREVLEDAALSRLILLGPGGAGKSVAIRQLVDAAKGQAGGEVLWCGAADFSTGEIEILLRACQFRASVLAWRAPDARLAVFVDALDEPDQERLGHWARGLARLGRVSNIRLITSVREDAWRRVEVMESQLKAWRLVTLRPWPEPLVTRLLAGNPRFAKLSAKSREILRTPILLDLFWRTFVEGDARSEEPGAAETRHGLMAEFWGERLLNARRHQTVRDLSRRSVALWAEAAAHLGAFEPHAELAEVTNVAVSEGVLVRSGPFGRRVEFRHPLLRDFALAQWCLDTGDAVGLVTRWRAIVGGIARRGVLRAVTEALLDARAKDERPELDLAAVIQLIATAGADWAEELSQFMGGCAVRAEYDPARWPARVQASLPATFGASLITSARLAVNASWARVLAGWSDSVSWLDPVFPRELANYAEILGTNLRRGGGETSFRDEAEQAARCLRRLADAGTFGDEFSRNDAWLCGYAIEVVAGILPDSVTFAWIERELDRATPRIRPRVLGRLPELARANAARAARVFRQAIGLHEQGGALRIRKENWQGLMHQHVLDWALDGDDRRGGLLRDFPEEFFPVAVELAEALWRDAAQDHPSHGVRFGSQAQAQDDTGGGAMSSQQLLDDMPLWFRWQGYLGHGLHEKALQILHKAAREWATRDIARFIGAVAEPLRRSHLSGVQAVVLDVMDDHRQVPEVAAMRRTAARDMRLYQSESLAYWAGRLLQDFWPELLEASKAELILWIRGDVTRQNENKRLHGRYLLGRLGSELWPEDLRAAYPAADDADAFEKRRPRWATSRPDNLEDDEAQIGRVLRSAAQAATPAPGDWAESVDRVALNAFYNLSQRLEIAKRPAAERAADLAEASRLALHLLAGSSAGRASLGLDANSWFWNALRKLFELRRANGEADGEVPLPPPPPELVCTCAELVLGLVEVVPDFLPGAMPERDAWGGIRDTVWTRALWLADEVFMWGPVRDEEALYARFARVVEQSFTKTDETGLLQMHCVVRVRPWHWMRWRFGGEVGPWLIWRQARHPTVLRWALSSFLRFDDDERRVEALRCLLGRQFTLSHGDLVDKIGEIIGVYSMAWFGDCRSVGAELPDEILRTPERFPLLAEKEARRQFWRGFAFGMKEQAKHTVALYDLSFDYGRLALAAWRVARVDSAGVEDEEERGHLVLFAVGWFDDAEIKKLNPSLLRPWWKELGPLLQAVAETGSREDCFSLFFNLRDKDYHHVIVAEDVLTWVETLAGRFGDKAGQFMPDLDERPSRGGGNTWRECLGYAASAVGSLHKAGFLTHERQRERARQVLTVLNAPPLRVPEARVELHELLSNG